MVELARTGQGQFVVSVNYTLEMRDAYKGLTLHTSKIRYTVGQQATESRGELIITYGEAGCQPDNAKPPQKGDFVSLRLFYSLG